MSERMFRLDKFQSTDFSTANTWHDDKFMTELEKVIGKEQLVSVSIDDVKAILEKDIEETVKENLLLDIAYAKKNKMTVLYYIIR